jgi:hypothetical protein
MRIFVFTGPTLPAEEAWRELDAVYLPPVAQGDVCRALLSRPVAIGIIDGQFDQVPAVWHKEILWAMSEGVHVYGSASMGALRAAELAPFGMVGVGKIFQAYRDGELEDDDEVALVHGPAASGFGAASEAMVNIRATLAQASRGGVIGEASRAELEKIAKALYYPERSYAILLQHGAARGVPASELRALAEWLPHGRVDQKRLDALAMLRAMREQLGSNPAPKQVDFKFESTVFWEHSLDSAGVSAAKPGEQGETVLLDSIFDELWLDPAACVVAHQEALMRYLVAEEARREGRGVTDEAARALEREFREKRGLLSDDAFGSWLEKNHLTPAEFTQLMCEEALLRQSARRPQSCLQRRVIDRLRLNGRYAPMLARCLEKQRALKNRGFESDDWEFDDAAGEALLDWHVNHMLSSDPRDVEQHRALAELARDSWPAFVRALVREYHYAKPNRPQSAP